MLQAVVAAVVGVLVWKTLARHWDEFRNLHVALEFSAPWITGSVLMILVSFGASIEAWRRVVHGWGERVGYVAAMRIWLVSNLGRYVPGKVWSVAGLALLARRAGVASWASAGSAIAIQAIAIGTAVIVVAAATPGATSWWGLGAALVLAIAIIAALAWHRSVALLSRLTGGDTGASLRPLPVIAVVESSVLGVLAWVTHGIAFWMLARGLGLAGSLSVLTACGVFPLGYVLGLLAVFAPGGLGVREVVLASLLTPALGVGGAAALSVASRLLLTVTEVGTPLVVLALTRTRKEDVSERA